MPWPAMSRLLSEMVPSTYVYRMCEALVTGDGSNVIFADYFDVPNAAMEGMLGLPMSRMRYCPVSAD